MGIPDHFTCFLRNLYAGPVANWLSEEALQIAEERSAKQGKKGQVHPTNAESQRTARREKAFFNEQCKETEENNRKDKRSLQESWKY